MRKSILAMRATAERARSRRTTPPLIATMSLRLAIPRRVALQQCPPPLHQPAPSCYGLFSVPRFLQRMVNCPYFHCLNPRVQSRACPRLLLSPITPRTGEIPRGLAEVKLKVLLFGGCVDSPHGLHGVSSISEMSLREIADTKSRVSAPTCALNDENPGLTLPRALELPQCRTK